MSEFAAEMRETLCSTETTGTGTVPLLSTEARGHESGLPSPSIYTLLLRVDCLNNGKHDGYTA